MTLEKVNGIQTLHLCSSCTAGWRHRGRRGKDECASIAAAVPNGLQEQKSRMGMFAVAEMPETRLSSRVLVPSSDNGTIGNAGV